MGVKESQTTDASLKDTISELESAKKATTSELNKAKKELTSLQREASAFSEIMKQQLEERATKVADLEISIQKMKENESNMESNITTLESEIKSLSESLQSVIQELTTAKNNMAELEQTEKKFIDENQNVEFKNQLKIIESEQESLENISKSESNILEEKSKGIETDTTTSLERILKLESEIAVIFKELVTTKEKLAAEASKQNQHEGQPESTTDKKQYKQNQSCNDLLATSNTNSTYSNIEFDDRAGEHQRATKEKDTMTLMNKGLVTKLVGTP